MTHFESRRKISFYTSVISIVIVAVYNLLRTGVSFQLDESFKSLGLAFFLLNAPIVIVERFTINNKVKILKDEYAWIFILMLLNCILGLLEIETIYFLGVIGVGSFIYNTLFYIKLASNREYLIVLFNLVIAIWICMMVWKGDYSHPLFLERLVTDSRIHIDTLYHISIAQMIKTYFIPSTGLNGLPFIHYHFGSHLIFAGLSGTLGISLSTFYQLSYPSIFFPLLMKFLSGAPIILAERKNAARYNFGFLFWILLTGFVIGIFPASKTLSKAFLATPPVFGSESYNVSVSFIFLLLNIILFNYERVEGVIKIKPHVYLLLIPLIFLLGLTKNSSLFIFNVLLFYLFIRYKLFKQLAINMSLLIISLVSLACVYITVDSKSPDGAFEFFHFYKTYIQLSVFSFILVYYFWSLLLISLCILIIRIKKRNGFSSENIEPYFIIIECTVLVCVVGALPSFLLRVNGGSVGFFMDLQMWLSLVFIATIIPDGSETIYKSIKGSNVLTLRRVTVATLVIVALYTIIIIHYNFRNSLKVFVKHYMQDQKRICGEPFDPDTKLSFTEMFLQISNSFPKISSCLSANKQYNVLNELSKMDTLSLHEKRKSMIVFNKVSILSKEYPCYKYPFFIPALTGISLKDGFVFEGCHGANYSFEYYKQVDLNNKSETELSTFNLLRLDLDSGRVVLRPAL